MRLPKMRNPEKLWSVTGDALLAMRELPTARIMFAGVAVKGEADSQASCERALAEVHSRKSSASHKVASSGANSVCCALARCRGHWK